MTFANRLGPDQARKNVGPDLDTNVLTLMVFLKDFTPEKIDFEKKQTTKSPQNYTVGIELIIDQSAY